MEMKDILDIDMGFEDEQLTLYLENIKKFDDDAFNMGTAGRIYSGHAGNSVNIKENLTNQRGQTAMPTTVRTSPVKGYEEGLQRSPPFGQL